MPDDLIDDKFWSLIEPLISTLASQERRHAGRKPTPDRAVLTGIVFVLRSGIPWNLLPQEMGYGSGAVCWRRLVAWQEAGIWPSIRETLLVELRRRGQLDEARAIADSLSIRAVLAGSTPAGVLRASARSTENAPGTVNYPRGRRRLTGLRQA